MNDKHTTCILVVTTHREIWLYLESDNIVMGMESHSTVHRDRLATLQYHRRATSAYAPRFKLLPLFAVIQEEIFVVPGARAFGSSEWSGGYQEMPCASFPTN